jgi:hypothetical protein
MAFGKSRQLYILHYTKVIDPTQEKFDMSVSLPDTASREEIKAVYDKMIWTCDKRIELINKVEMEAQKQEVKVAYGETEKNAANRDKIKGSAKGN